MSSGSEKISNLVFVVFQEQKKVHFFNVVEISAPLKSSLKTSKNEVKNEQKI